MNLYPIAKHIHITLAGLAILLLLVRGALLLTRPALLAAKPMRILPHIMATLLLLSAIALLGIGQINPLETPWVLAKISGFVLYIVLTMSVMKRMKTLQQKLAVWGLALLTLGYLVAVAVSKQVWPF